MNTWSKFVLNWLSFSIPLKFMNYNYTSCYNDDAYSEIGSLLPIALQ